MGYYWLAPSPIGYLYLEENKEGLCKLSFCDKPSDNLSISPMGKFTKLAVTQLEEYFAKKRTAFTVPLSLKGTAFQEDIWHALQKIPYGKIISYKELAEKAGHPKAYRAAGNANNKNPIAIIIPCHRVCGVDGSLTGYGGGLDKKQFLLDLEN